MARSIALPLEQASASNARFDDVEPPTTRRVHAFHLPDEARRVEEHLASQRQRDEDATVTIGAEENRKLLASVFSYGADREPGPNTDDEPTLDAPVPAVALEAMRQLTPVPAEPKRMTRPPPLRGLILTSPPPRSTPRREVAPEAVIALADLPRPAKPLVIEPPASGWRKKLDPDVAQAGREERDAEARRRTTATFAIHLPKRDTETLVVAGIWATALSLIAFLMFIVSSA